MLYIQSEARQGVAVYLGPAESVHLKEIRGTPEDYGSILRGPHDRCDVGHPFRVLVERSSRSAGCLFGCWFVMTVNV